GKMDPFIDLVVDSQRFRTKTVTGGGRNPAFNQTFRFNILDGCKFLQIEVWDEDAVNNDHIGSCRVPLDKAFTTGIDDQWFELVTRSGKSAGQVHMCLNFAPRVRSTSHTLAPLTHSPVLID
ncbi:C2 domain-containing protein, partial [Catenaria anguillulae PL171]